MQESSLTKLLYLSDKTKTIRSVRCAIELEKHTVLSVEHCLFSSDFACLVKAMRGNKKLFDSSSPITDSWSAYIYRARTSKTPQNIPQQNSVEENFGISFSEMCTAKAKRSTFLIPTGFLLTDYGAKFGLSLKPNAAFWTTSIKIPHLELSVYFVSVFAVRDICPGEEITLGYGPTDRGHAEAVRIDSAEYVPPQPIRDELMRQLQLYILTAECRSLMFWHLLRPHTSYVHNDHFRSGCAWIEAQLARCEPSKGLKEAAVS